jgi:integrase
MGIAGETDKQMPFSLSVIRAAGYQHSFLFEPCCCRILSLVYEETRAMPGKRAKILSAADVGDLLVFASCTRQPLRNTVMVLLSAKAGLRAGEIANLAWDMVLDATGQISGLIELADSAAKKCSGRSVPVHPDLAAALAAWRQASPSSEYVIASERGGRMRPLSIVVWFNRAFKNIGLKGCSSHSGRRTFVTRAARIVHKAGGSLRDVQLLAGHRSIQTTQRYIDGDSDAQRKLVAMI